MLSAASWVTLGKFKPTSCDPYYKVRAGNTHKDVDGAMLQSVKGEEYCLLVKREQAFTCWIETYSAHQRMQGISRRLSTIGHLSHRSGAPGDKAPGGNSFAPQFFLWILSSCKSLGTASFQGLPHKVCTMPEPWGKELQGVREPQLFWKAGSSSQHLHHTWSEAAGTYKANAT